MPKDASERMPEQGGRHVTHEKHRRPNRARGRYKVLGGKQRAKQVASGQTLNMSGTGVLFTTDGTRYREIRIQNTSGRRLFPFAESARAV